MTSYLHNAMIASIAAVNLPALFEIEAIKQRFIKNITISNSRTRGAISKIYVIYSEIANIGDISDIGDFRYRYRQIMPISIGIGGKSDIGTSLKMSMNTQFRNF